MNVATRACASRAAVALLLLALAGCSIHHTTVGLPLPSVDGLRIGESTKADVLAVLGAPNSLRRQYDGDMFLYRRSDTDSRLLRLIPYLVIYERTRATLRDDRIAVLFDARGVLSGIGVEREIPEG
ncbi:MAG: hypothetical protein H6825_15210 [Planctomycetes bacterium]|nr:hypothetical protein [Planctomycetota bacterium]